jgi:glycerol kinase
MPELLLAIDAGTTTARVALFTPAGAMIAVSRAALATRSPAPGVMEQDAPGVWRAVRRTIFAALDTAGRSLADVGAIGVTSQRASAMLWSKKTGRPLTPLVLWNDLRGVARAGELRAEGFMLAPQQSAAKLEAILKAAPEARPFLAAGDLAFGNIDSFLIFKLTGGAAHVTDASQAWPSGYLDLASLGWNAALIAHQGLDERMFPRVADTFGPIALTDPGTLGGAVPITADIADQQAALVAHGGGAGAGAAKVTYGTSAPLDVATGADFVFKSLAIPPFIVSSVGGETLFCLEGMVISAGAALDWLRRVARMGGHARFETLAASVDSAGGAAFLPSLSGLGAPAPDPGRTGAFTGLTPSVGPAHLARAAMEGVAQRVREVFDHLFELAGLTPPPSLGVDGGMTASAAFLQIQADILGRPVRRHAVREATACGAAICAGRGAGLLTPADAAAFVRYDRIFEPGISPDESASRHHAWSRAVYGDQGHT